MACNQGSEWIMMQFAEGPSFPRISNCLIQIWNAQNFHLLLCNHKQVITNGSTKLTLHQNCWVATLFCRNLAAALDVGGGLPIVPDGSGWPRKYELSAVLQLQAGIN